MNGANYFWQGGRRIEIEHADDLVTVELDADDGLGAIAAEAGVPPEEVERIAPSLARVRLPQDRDRKMRAMRRGRVVHHVYCRKGAPESLIHISDSFFVQFAEGTSEQTIRDWLREERLEVVDRPAPRRLLVRVTDETGRNPIRVANATAARPDVEYAEPNLLREPHHCATLPPDALFTNQWHLHAPADADELTAGADISAPDAWDLTLGSREIVVCVADDAVDLSHPDFDGEDKLAGALDVQSVGLTSITVGSDVSPRPGDYHGTPCAGVAVAEANGLGTVGVAPGCALLAVRFSLRMTDGQYEQMFRLISGQADVVSCSWGVGPADAPMSSALRATLAELAATGGRRGKGLVVCVAAGNNNCPVFDAHNTAPYEYVDSAGVRRIYAGPIDRWVANHPDVLTIAAVTSEKKRSAYSSWGAEIDVCAPSNNFDDLFRFTPPGRGVWTTDNEGFGARSDFTAGSRWTGRFGGTSSATPTVAGVAGLVLSAHPGLTAEAVRQLLRDTASQDLLVDSATPVNVPGDFGTDGHSPWFGHGKVDAHAAVLRALELAGGGRSVIVEAEGLPLVIPDDGDPIESTIEVEADGPIDDLRVGVSIEHTFIGDLRVDLIGPDGTVVTLHDHQGWSADDIERTYTIEERPGLGHFRGLAAVGTWRLRVRDTWAWDTGSLEGWRLGLKLGAPDVLSPQPAARKGAKHPAPRQKQAGSRS